MNNHKFVQGISYTCRECGFVSEHKIHDTNTAIEGYWKPTLDKYWKLCEF